MSELKVQTWLYVHTFVENHASDQAFLIDTAFRFETSNLCNTLKNSRFRPKSTPSFLSRFNLQEHDLLAIISKFAIFDILH